MCGIAGKLHFKPHKFGRQAELSRIKKTLQILKHRGPDDRGYFLGQNIWLAAARLAIIDLSPKAHQPMVSRDGNLVLVFNGEIYNYREIRKTLKDRYNFNSESDTEVLLVLYHVYGVGCLKFLRGMFAFALWDKKLKRLFLARDRLGKKPLKYFLNRQFLIFASELKAFIDLPDVPKAVDYQALSEFISLGYVPSPKTGFKGIKKLPPAHYLLADSQGRITIKRYWEPLYTPKFALAEAERLRLVKDTLTESISMRLRSDVPLGFHLSGGTDSTLIAALGSRIAKNKIKTFTVGFEDGYMDESESARETSLLIGSEHHEIKVKEDSFNNLPEIIRAYEEPFADASILPTWALMKETAKYVTVALNGDGGDETFAGYPRYLFYLYYPYLHLLQAGLLAFFFSGLYKFRSNRNFSLLADKYLPSLKMRKFAGYLSTVEWVSGIQKEKLLLQKIPDRSDIRRTPGSESLDGILRFDSLTYLPDYLLVKTDIASMHHSLEVRSPYLDHLFFETAARLPESDKIRGLTSKYLLRKLLKEVLPQVKPKRKHGFLPPLSSWFRGKYSRQLKDEITDANFRAISYLNHPYVDRLYREHLSCRHDHSGILWTLLCLKNWHRQFAF